MGKRRVLVAAELLEQFFKGNARPAETDFPQDATLIAIERTRRRFEFEFVFESSQWPRSLEIALFEPRYTTKGAV